MTCSYLSLEEYAALPEDDGWRDELSRGRLVREPQPGYAHTVIADNIRELLRDQQVRGHGRAFVDAGFLLSRDPPTVRGPDVAFVLADHLPKTLPRIWLERGPDLAVEVLSPSNRRARIEAKVRDYFDAGTPLVWIVDPRRRTVQVRLREGTVTLFTAGDVLTGAPVLPELRVRVGELFRI